MMTEDLTAADSIELETATVRRRATENEFDVGASRWQKYGNDRLYCNDWSIVEYVDLETGKIHFNGRKPSGDVHVEGDQMVIDVVCGEKEYHVVFSLEGDAFEADDKDEEDEIEEEPSLEDELSAILSSDDEDGTEAEVACDGGEDVTEHIRDEEIESAIARHDDTDHPEVTTLEEARNLLAEIQFSFERYWMEFMDLVEDGDLEVVEDTGDVLVLADHTGHGWGDELSELDADRVTASVLESTHHAAANRLVSYSWSTSDPFVIRKPDGVQNGQRYVEAVMNFLISEGLSPGQAWSVYGVHVAGHSRNAWAVMCGYSDHSAVSEPLRKAKEKAPHLALTD